MLPDGFVALFNGRDLTGWKGLVGNPKVRAEMTPEKLAEAQKKADEEMRAHWQVVDGALVFDGKGIAPGITGRCEGWAGAITHAAIVAFPS